MLFGPPHVGKAIALLRKPVCSQKDLAAAIGVDQATMNRYEKGRKPIPEDALKKIARLVNREVIEILDMAYAIFRFNYCRDEAQRTGADLEEIIARYDSHVTVEEIHAARASYLEKLDELERKKTELLGQQKIKGFSVLRYVVEEEGEEIGEETKKSTREKARKDQPSRKRPKP
jgi:transcriptional regulator with XRE-family HTH domain